MRGIAIVVLLVVTIGLVGCGTNDNPALPSTKDPTGPATIIVTTVASTEVPATDAPSSDSGGTVGDEQAYLTFFLEITEGYADAFRTFGELNQRAGADTQLLVDADWVREAQASTVAIEQISQRVLDYEGVPERFASVHAKLIEAAQKYNEAMPLYRDGLDTMNVDSTTQSFSLIGEATMIVQEVTQEVAGLINPS